MPPSTNLCIFENNLQICIRVIWFYREVGHGRDLLMPCTALDVKAPSDGQLLWRVFGLKLLMI